MRWLAVVVLLGWLIFGLVANGVLAAECPNCTPVVVYPEPTMEALQNAQATIVAGLSERLAGIQGVLEAQATRAAEPTPTATPVATSVATSTPEPTAAAVAATATAVAVGLVVQGPYAETRLEFYQVVVLSVLLFVSLTGVLLQWLGR